MPKYGLVMMCKDEAAVVGDCLASLRPYIGAWTVLDTGSTDGTQDIIRAALAGIPGTLVEEPFVDFGTSRTRSFELARGTADWLFATDADMVWTIDPDFEPDPATDAYALAMGDANLTWRLPLIHRGDLPWVSIGACHEYSALEGGVQPVRTPTDKVRIRMPQHAARRSEAKSRWYLDLLLGWHEEHPDDERTVFFIGQAYLSLGDRENARQYYGKRAGMRGAPDETYYAAYMAAMLAEEGAKRQSELLAAWEFRPERWEALNAYCRELNHSGLHQAVYRLTAGEFPPSDDMSFVHPWVSEWGMTLERTIACYWTGHLDECRELAARLLARDDLPEDVRAAVRWHLDACDEAVAA